MSTLMDEEIKRWTAKRKTALVLEIIQGKTSVSEASRTYDLPPSEIESWGRWLAEGSLAAHRVRVIAGMTHALNTIVEPDPTRIRPSDIGRTVSPDLVDEVARFLDSASGQAR